MQKPLSADWNFLLKWSFFSGSYVYVQLFHLMAMKRTYSLQILNLHIKR